MRIFFLQKIEFIYPDFAPFHHSALFLFENTYSYDKLITVKLVVISNRSEIHKLHFSGLIIIMSDMKTSHRSLGPAPFASFDDMLPDDGNEVSLLI